MALQIPYDIDYGTRNAVLSALALEVEAAGGTVAGISPLAGETHPNWVMFINRLNVAVNALGASPPLPTYRWLDYSAFGSVVSAIQDAIEPILNPPPVVNPANFDITLPAGNLQTVGTVTATNGGSSFAITGGNALGYFAISGAGVLLTSATGANMTGGVYALMVTCRNAGGTSAPGNVTVTAA
jgi:hypothetical protein